MKELRRKQVLRQVLYSWPSLIGVLLITFLLAKGSFGLMVKERQSAERVSNLEAEAKAYDIREAELKESIDKLKTDEGIIEEIRDKFSVTRPGEQVAIIIDERGKPASSTQSASERIRGLWQSFVNLFGN